jgi:hypothetical protein
MTCAKLLTVVGLSLDILGFCVLFVRVEKRLKKSDDRPFWGQNDPWERYAFLSIIVGFILQALSVVCFP